jgi:hypothetical protein
MEGVWTGVTTAAVPPGGAPYFAPYLSDGRCDLRYSTLRVQAASADLCATHCVGAPDCVFYSFKQPAAGTSGAGDCALFPFCVAESAINYTTRRAVDVENLIAATCRAELRVHGLAITLNVHSCAGTAAGVPVARRSAQTGEMRGILLSTGRVDVKCDALHGADALPCEALQRLPGLLSQPYEFWRLRVRWTWSSADRVAGAVDTIIFTAGISDGDNEWPLQLSVLPAAVEPDLATAFEADGGSSAAAVPALRGVLRLRLRRAAAQPKPAGRELAVIGLLAAGDECRRALTTTLGLASTSPDCAAAVSAVLPGTSDAAGADRISRASTACANPCRPALAAAVGEAASRCSAAWRGAPLLIAAAERLAADGAPVLLAHMSGLRDFLTDLMRVADAAYLLAVACATNRRGTRCAVVEDSLRSCQLAVPTGRAPGAVVRRTLLLQSPLLFAPGYDDSVGGLCNDNCTKNIKDYLFEEGCCATTVAAAEELWVDTVCRTAIGPRFWVDWGGGTELELFRVSDACRVPSSLGAGVSSSTAAAAAIVNLQCRASQCGLGVDGGAWPAACCNDCVCANGGVKVCTSATP